MIKSSKSEITKGTDLEEDLKTEIFYDITSQRPKKGEVNI